MHRVRWVAAATALVCAARAPAEVLPASAVAADLAYLRDVWAARERSLTPAARARVASFIDAHLERPRAMERHELALLFWEAQALTGNNHSQSSFLDVDGLFTSLPFSCWFFPEGAVVTRAHPDYRRLLGARIVAIGGVSTEEATRRVERFIAGTPQRKRYVAPALLARLEVLEAVGLARGRAADVDLVLPSGERVAERLGPAPSPDPAARSAPWRASMVPGKGPAPWPHVLDSLPALPPYVRPPDEMSSLSLGEDVLYVRSTSLASPGDEMSVQRKAYEVVDGAVKSGRRPRDLVVDLRYNGGGNLFNVLSLAVELPKLVGPRGRVYVVTGRATNSAAIVFAALLKAHAPERTTIAGEEVSDDLWFWSEGGDLRAPASRLPLHYADGFHDWAHGCEDLSRCYWPVVFHGVAVGSLAPDLPVDLTFADYAAGRDPVLDRILAEIANGRRGGERAR